MSVVRQSLLLLIMVFVTGCSEEAAENAGDTSSSQSSQAPQSDQPAQAGSPTGNDTVTAVSAPLGLATTVSIGSEYYCKFPGILDDTDRTIVYKLSPPQLQYVQTDDGVLNGGDLSADVEGKGTLGGVYALYNDSFFISIPDFGNLKQYSFNHFSYSDMLAGMSLSLPITNVFGTREMVEADCILRKHGAGTASPVSSISCNPGTLQDTTDLYFSADRTLRGVTRSSGSFGDLTYTNLGTYIYNPNTAEMKILLRDADDRCCTEDFSSAVFIISNNGAQIVSADVSEADGLVAGLTCSIG